MVSVVEVGATRATCGNGKRQTEQSVGSLERETIKLSWTDKGYVKYEDVVEAHGGITRRRTYAIGQAAASRSCSGASKVPKAPPAKNRTDQRGSE